MKPETLGKIVSTFVPKDILLMSELGNWYDANPYHKFQKGDIIILKTRSAFGYGFRPVGLVEGFSVDKSETTGRKEGTYHILMHTDFAGDYYKFAELNIVPEGIGRIAEKQKHFKWNIENQFRKVRCGSIEDALKIYHSKEVPKEKIFKGQQILSLNNISEKQY